MAEGDLKRYRRKGPNATTRLLRDEILAQGRGQTVLDVGAGVGALSFELLAGGFERATAVDAAPAYVAAAREEAERRHQEGCLELRQGDFVDLAADVPSTDAVVMDRAVCCYQAYKPLLVAGLTHSRRLFGYSYPHDRWYVRLVVAAQNAVRALMGNPFRTYVHPARAMAELIRQHGFRRTSRRAMLVWSIEVYIRDAS